MTPTRELVPFFAPGSSTMSLKSSLSYKYRPTVKYEVDLSSGDGQTMGSLNIVFRTQSAGLISAMTSFFRSKTSASHRFSAAPFPARCTTGASFVRSRCRAERR